LYAIQWPSLSGKAEQSMWMVSTVAAMDGTEKKLKLLRC
jgi:hypothetical protein